MVTEKIIPRKQMDPGKGNTIDTKYYVEVLKHQQKILPAQQQQKCNTCTKIAKNERTTDNAKNLTPN